MHDHCRNSNELERETLAQFELVEPQNGIGRPRIQEPAGSSGSVATFSDNLVVAPPGGQQQGHQQHQLAAVQELAAGSGAYEGQLLGPAVRFARPGASRQREHSADLMNQRNSLDLSNPERTQQQQQQQQQTFLERLSSVELLFLISCLMFLVLLVFGLVASYYCFRRQANRNANQRASAILKRKRRFVGPTGALGQQAAISPAGLQQRLYRHHQQQQQQQHFQRPPSSPESDLSGRGLLAGRPYMLNRAFVTDSGAYLKPVYAGPQPANGRAGQQRFWSAEQKPIVGRREASTGGQQLDGQLGYAAGRQQRHLLPAARHRQAMAAAAAANGQSGWSSMRPARSNADFSPASQQEERLFAGHSHEPLLLFGPDYPASSSARPQLAAQTKEAAKCALVSKARQVHAARTSPSLWRAKSLSSVQAGEPRTWQRDNTRAGGTLSRHELFLQGNGKQRLCLRGGEPAARQLGRFRQESDERPELSSESETAERASGAGSSNINAIGAGQPPRESKILLKSIEDSYITNFTEIHEQEYMKRDSRRPLNLAEWRRAIQLGGPRAASRGGGSSESESGSGGGSGGDSDGFASEREQEDEAERYQSAQTNLRSLTELDVNFAKSLLMPARPSRSLAGSSSSGSGSDSGDGNTNRSAGRQADAPKADEGDSAASRGAELRAPTEAVQATATERPQSPDLILSPDYDYSRLELGGSSSPANNSVSYV